MKKDKTPRVQVGDLASHVFSERIGLVVKLADDRLARQNSSFDVVWNSGQKAHNIWDYDCEVISESR